jgi:hypothetical protein
MVSTLIVEENHDIREIVLDVFWDLRRNRAVRVGVVPRGSEARA